VSTPGSVCDAANHSLEICRQNLSPAKTVFSTGSLHRSQMPCPSRSGRSRAGRLRTDPLLNKEVLFGVGFGNKKAAMCSGFELRKEPSDGLEPSTPSSPSSDEEGTAGTAGEPRHERRARRANRPRTSDRGRTRLPAVVFPQCSLGTGSVRRQTRGRSPAAVFAPRRYSSPARSAMESTMREGR
jgi:hypothetical protein